MKYVIATAFSALLLGTVLTPAMAEDHPQRIPPATEWATKANFQQRTVRPPEFPKWAPAQAQAPALPRLSHRMGDEGKLPATNGVSTRVPEQGAGTENPK